MRSTNKLFVLIVVAVFVLSLLTPLKIDHTLAAPYQTLLGKTIKAKEEVNFIFSSSSILLFGCLIFHLTSVLFLFLKNSKRSAFFGLVSSIVQVPMLFVLYLLLWFKVELIAVPKIESHIGLGYYLLCTFTGITIVINYQRYRAL